MNQNERSLYAEFNHRLSVAYAAGRNVMHTAEEFILEKRLDAERYRKEAGLIAYDLQAGTYREWARGNFTFLEKWCAQIASILNTHFTNAHSIMEVGVGEATTLAGIAKALNNGGNFFGFDQSLSRLLHARDWCKSETVNPKLFVADLTSIPISDNSVDVVYSSHSLEPNRGFEKSMIEEVLRVSRFGAVLVEPLYELASAGAQNRMDQHGYVRGLHEVCKTMDAEIAEYRLLDVCQNVLNPSGVIVLKKTLNLKAVQQPEWQCPLTGELLTDRGGFFAASSSGIIYPVIDGFPLLRIEHAIRASALAR